MQRTMTWTWPTWSRCRRDCRSGPPALVEMAHSQVVVQVGEAELPGPLLVAPLGESSVVVFGWARCRIRVVPGASTDGHARSPRRWRRASIPDCDDHGSSRRSSRIRTWRRLLLKRINNVRTPVGMKVRAGALSRGRPLVRHRDKDFVAAGVARVGRVVEVQNERPQLEDGQVLDIENVV